ncbi:hypothetical protein [Breznakibacter xylanolyticus]|nr:hypothetical protein [Breznakibacter xylanolyticus]MBN2744718.1 hypothetical protein [Marinilabiliaceae bacterium]
MKSFKVQVHNNKAEFFKELMKNFDFVEFEEVDAFYEPRVYPGAQFEIRSNSAIATSAPQLPTSPKVPPVPDEAIESLKKALSHINEIRQNRR